MPLRINGRPYSTLLVIKLHQALIDGLVVLVTLDQHFRCSSQQFDSFAPLPLLDLCLCQMLIFVVTELKVVVVCIFPLLYINCLCALWGAGLSVQGAELGFNLNDQLWLK